MKKIINTIVTILMIIVLAGCSTASDRYEIPPEPEIETKSYIDQYIPLEPPIKKLVGEYLSAGVYMLVILDNMNLSDFPNKFMTLWEICLEIKRGEKTRLRLVDMSWKEMKAELTWSNLKVAARNAVMSTIEEIVIYVVGEINIISPGIGGLGDKSGLFHDLGKREAERRRRISQVEVFDVN